jgi:hypothetical protein
MSPFEDLASLTSLFAITYMHTHMDPSIKSENTKTQCLFVFSPFIAPTYSHAIVQTQMVGREEVFSQRLQQSQQLAN